MITTRPQTPTQAQSNHTNYPSRHAIDDEVVFVPASQVSSILLSPGIVCKVVGVSFIPGKVFYDLALPIDMFEFYEVHPLMRVDSIFVFAKP